IDFGIARVEDITGITRTKQPLGTYGYIAPEFLSRGESTTASDMFALGGVLVYAATGEAPFPGDSSAVLLYKVVHEEPELGDLEGEVREVVEGCLAKDPAARPAPA
ncbi:protein kinase domain-containing protein, partial [Streptomyces sp. NRRL S-1896]|uniref:protein kinase domain-containing protein n=1 Tax=Streptomyces sp. NRRL S-1896 TaxID=1463893 RepID=UPI0004CD579B